MEAIQSTVVRRPPRIEAQRRRIEARVRCAQQASRPRTPQAGVRRDTQAGVRRTQARKPNRGKAMLALVISLIAGALMMIAAYMSTSELRNTAWEKEQTASAQQAPAAPAAPAAPTGVYVTAP